MPINSKYILGLVLMVFISCKEKPETRDEYIQRALQEKIDKHIVDSKALCIKELDKKANELADSILLQEALALDSLQSKLPIVPPKPAFIEPEPIGDSLAVKPFLEKPKNIVDSSGLSN